MAHSIDDRKTSAFNHLQTWLADQRRHIQERAALDARAVYVEASRKMQEETRRLEAESAKLQAQRFKELNDQLRDDYMKRLKEAVGHDVPLQAAGEATWEDTDPLRPARARRLGEKRDAPGRPPRQDGAISPVRSTTLTLDQDYFLFNRMRMLRSNLSGALRSIVEELRAIYAERAAAQTPPTPAPAPPPPKPVKTKAEIDAEAKRRAAQAKKFGY